MDGVIMLPQGSELFEEVPDWYDTLRNSYLLVRRNVRVIPCLVGPVPRGPGPRDTLGVTSVLQGSCDSESLGKWLGDAC